MPVVPVVVTLRARLVADTPPAAADPGRARVYRPLVVGPAVLRHRSAGAWEVAVSTDGALRPLGCRPAIRTLAWPATMRPQARRLALALVTPADVARAGEKGGPTPEMPREIRSDMYGWALLYQPRGMRGTALVDPHEDFADLPAFYEAPFEMLDRAAFLAARGVATRPLALVTQPEDFGVDGAGRVRNRYWPEARCRPPTACDWFG